MCLFLFVFGRATQKKIPFNENPYAKLRLGFHTEANSTLSCLEFAQNGFGTRGAGCLASAWRRSSSVETLSLDGNNLEDEGVHRFLIFWTATAPYQGLMLRTVASPIEAAVARNCGTVAFFIFLDARLRRRLSYGAIAFLFFGRAIQKKTEQYYYCCFFWDHDSVEDLAMRPLLFVLGRATQRKI